MRVQRKRFRRTSSLAVAVFTILALGMLFASSAIAAQGVDIGVDGCTVTVTFDDQDGATGSVTATRIPPPQNGVGDVVFSDTINLDANGDGSITFALQFAGDPIQQGGNEGEFHVKVEADSDPGQSTRVFFAPDCPDPAPPPPPTDPPTDVPPPEGGVDTGTAPVDGTSPILPVIGLILLVGSTLWMRRRSTS